MRKSLRLSAIALLTTALTAFPAHALSLNLGGDGPLVDLGNGNNADATVSVDTGNLLDGGDGGTKADAAVQVNLGDIGGSDDDAGGALGSIIDNDGDGGLVNLGGNHDLIDLGGNGDSVIDLGGDGNLLDLGGSGGLVDLADIDLGDGPLLDLTGGSGEGGLVDVDLGRGDLLDLGETGSILDLGSDGDLLDLGSSGTLLDLGSDGDLLDLGGTSGELVALDLGNTRVNAGLNLKGGDKPLAKVTIGTGKDGVAGTGLLSDTNGSATIGGSNAATVAISSGDDSGGSGGGGGGNGGGSIGGNGIGGGGSSGSGNGGGGSASGNGSGGGSGGGSGIDLFGPPNGDGDACLTLNASQLGQLIDRHAYNPATFSSWANARQLKIVEVDFCDRAVADVAAAAGGSANVARLQAFLAAQAKVRAGLESKGHSAGDVIAADHSGNILIVYVI